MATGSSASSADILGQTFWMNHFVLPLIAAIVVLSIMEHTGLDLWLADLWFSSEGGRWALRDHWFTYDVIHHYGKMLVIGLGLLVAIVILASYRSPGLLQWRKPAVYLLTSMIVLPALIAVGKKFSDVPCPWDLMRYGGDMSYQHNLSYRLSTVATGHCFPAGHASGGFALLAVYFMAYCHVRRRVLFLLPGLLVGITFGLGQQARGAHFLSHDLWTMSLCWFGALGLYLCFRPWTWSGAK